VLKEGSQRDDGYRSGSRGEAVAIAPELADPYRRMREREDPGAEQLREDFERLQDWAKSALPGRTPLREVERERRPARGQACHPRVERWWLALLVAVAVSLAADAQRYRDADRRERT
jgi:hypothetical protein